MVESWLESGWPPHSLSRLSIRHYQGGVEHAVGGPPQPSLRPVWDESGTDTGSKSIARCRYENGKLGFQPVYRRRGRAPQTVSDKSVPAGPADWTALLDDLHALAVASLGKRSQKVTNVLAAADLSETGLEAAIDQIEGMRLTFVDPVRLADLSDAMKVVLAAHTGQPLPARQSGVPRTPFYGGSDPGFMAATTGVAGCGGMVCVGAVLTTTLITPVVTTHLLALR